MKIVTLIMFKTKNISPTLNKLIHIAYWILGFSTVVYSNGKFKIRGASWWFQMILVILITWERIDTLVNVNLPTFRKNFKIIGVIYMSAKTIELICVITCWMVRSKFRANEMIRFYSNLKQVDVLLARKQNDMFENNSKMYRWYFTISTCFVVFEKIKRGGSFYQCLQTLKYLSMNMAFLHFIAQINECILRMKVLNDKLCDLESINYDFEYINLAKAFVKTKKIVNVAKEEISLRKEERSFKGRSFKCIMYENIRKLTFFFSNFR